VELLENVGRYEIVGELGAGSMSRVYLAHDPNLDRQIALKVVVKGWTLDTQEQKELERRFLLEARAVGKLSHPGIVRVYDADTDPSSGVPYIAMEWVQGRSLRSHLEEKGRLTGNRTLEILAQVARALDYAHRKGRIHRDIKPSNILIEKDGRAKVSDFGVAKIMTETHTMSGHVLGTPAYMAPEQVRDEPLDGRSDLFSLGAVLYQCLTGALPFAGDSLVQVVYKILNVEPRPLQLPESPTSQLLTTIAQRALQKDPSARFQSGEEFALALHEVQDLMGDETAEDLDPAAADRSPPPALLQFPPAAVAPAGSASEVTESLTLQLTTSEIEEAVTRPGVGATETDTTVPTALASSHDDSSPTKTWQWLVAAAVLLVMAAVLSVLAPRHAVSPVPDSSRKTVMQTTPIPSPATGPQVGADSMPPMAATSPPATAAETTEPGPAPRVSPQPTTDAGPARPVSPEKTSQQPELAAAGREPGAGASQPRTDDAPIGAAIEARSLVTPAVSVVEIRYRHKTEKTNLSVSLDGKVVWSEPLKRPVNPLAWATGKDVVAIVPVPIGMHSLEIRVSIPDKDFEASRKLRSYFAEGQQRVLKVTLNRSRNDLRLRWKE
jgi:serine/threonine-protein kinase